MGYTTFIGEKNRAKANAQYAIGLCKRICCPKDHLTNGVFCKRHRDKNRAYQRGRLKRIAKEQKRR